MLLIFSEQKWLEEKKQVLLVASDHVERLQTEKETLSEHRWLWGVKGSKGVESYRSVEKENIEKLMKANILKIQLEKI